MSSLLRLERQQKDFLKPIMNSHIIPFSYSFGIETTNTFIHSRSFLENHTRFETKMGKVYICFRTETAQKPYPLGRHMPVSTYCRGLLQSVTLFCSFADISFNKCLNFIFDFSYYYNLALVISQCHKLSVIFIYARTL